LSRVDDTWGGMSATKIGTAPMTSLPAWGAYAFN